MNQPRICPIPGHALIVLFREGKRLKLEPRMAMGWNQKKEPKAIGRVAGRRPTMRNLVQSSLRDLRLNDRLTQR
jgi:hypothetical protein